MSMEEYFSLLSTHCKDSGATSKLLQDIIVKLRALDEGALQNNLSSSVSALFSVWSDIDEECIGLAAKVLHEMFTKCGVDLFVNNVSASVFWGLKDGPPSLKEALLELLMCSLIAVSEDLLELCIKEGFMDAMLEEITSNDLLVQLNVIELLTDLILLSPSSMQFLYSNNVLPVLHNSLIEAQANPDGGLQHVALVKFFGSFLGRYPKECLQAYPDFLQLIYSYVRFYDSLPIGLRLLAFDTIALAASAPEGKRILASQGAAMKEAMECLGRAIRNGTLDIRVRHLEALEKIFTVEDPTEMNEFSELLLDWFNSIYSQPTAQQLFSLIKAPFEAHQVAMYKVLRALALFRWFPQKIKEAEGFFDFLISRAELSTEAQHVKFELIQRLASNPDVKAAFSPTEQMKLTEYIRHGAMYYKAVPQFAMV
ncbi:Proteasom PSMB domain containing protein [Trichuris trichiura]|uniref:26S proteasome non-ATPase regulatory subunit 5 n=1 Tax=Trichuris trichiura TaxID=36087 RepID=A0A077ZJX0_TRITR|nr:Proteasom PSMB domain containing protein [Trichuris trichiura]